MSLSCFKKLKRGDALYFSENAPLIFDSWSREHDKNGDEHFFIFTSLNYTTGTEGLIYTSQIESLHKIVKNKIR